MGSCPHLSIPLFNVSMAAATLRCFCRSPAFFSQNSGISGVTELAAVIAIRNGLHCVLFETKSKLVARTSGRGLSQVTKKRPINPPDCLTPRFSEVQTTEAPGASLGSALRFQSQIGRA